MHARRWRRARSWPSCRRWNGRGRGRGSSSARSLRPPAPAASPGARPRGRGRGPRAPLAICIRQPGLPAATTRGAGLADAGDLQVEQAVGHLGLEDIVDAGAAAAEVAVAQLHQRAGPGCAAAARAARCAPSARARGGRRRGTSRSASAGRSGRSASASSSVTSRTRAPSRAAAAPGSQWPYSRMAEPQPAALVTSQSTSSGNAAASAAARCPEIVEPPGVQVERAAAALRPRHDDVPARQREQARRSSALTSAKR